MNELCPFLYKRGQSVSLKFHNPIKREDVEARTSVIWGWKTQGVYHTGSGFELPIEECWDMSVLRLWNGDNAT